MRYRLFAAVVRLLARIILGSSLIVEGREQIPRRGPVLLVGNHVGTVDPPLTGALVPRSDVHYMAKSEHFRTALLRWLFRGYHAFPVVRGTADRAALRHSLHLLASGHVLMLYPEGHRSWDGQMRRPHPGAGFLARHSGAPVVPVAIWGSEDVIPKGKKLPRRVTVHVHFGEAERLPVSITDNQLAADHLMRRVAELLPEEYRGVFREPMDTASLPPPAA